MKKNYTLNRLFAQAKMLLNKHQCSDNQSRLRLKFEIAEDIENNHNPCLECIIIYEKEFDYRFFASGNTPETAIYKFEECLIRSKAQWKEPMVVSIDLEIPDDYKNNLPFGGG